MVHVSNAANVVHEALSHDVAHTRFEADVYPGYILTSLSRLGTSSAAPTPRTRPVTTSGSTIAGAARGTGAMASAADHVHQLPSSYSSTPPKNVESGH